MVSIFFFNLSFYNLLIIITFFFLLKLINNILLNSKIFIYNIKVLNNILILSNSELLFFTILQIVITLSFKTLNSLWLEYFNFIFFSCLFFLIFNLIILYLIKPNNYHTMDINLINNLNIWFYLSLTSLYLVNNFIVLLLVLEFISILYYFFFLQQVSIDVRSYIKLKNLLNTYLWLSFFTLIFLFFSFIVITINIGSLNFNEINLLYTNIPSYSWAFLFTGLLIKLGISGFHILKFQVYKHLSSFFILFFSMYSFYINAIIIAFIFIHFWTIILTFYQIILYIILFFNFLILINSSKLYSFYQFLAFSTINTWLLLFLFLILN